MIRLALALALALALSLALAATSPHALAQSPSPPAPTHTPTPSPEDAPQRLYDEEIPTDGGGDYRVVHPIVERLHDLGHALRREEEDPDTFWSAPSSDPNLRPITCDPGAGLRPGAESLYAPGGDTPGGISIGYFPPRDPLTFVVADLHAGGADDLVSALACPELLGEGEGTEIELVRRPGTMIRAVLDDEGHARLDAALRAWRAVAARGATVDVRVVDLPANDPLLDPARPGTPGAATREELDRLLAACRSSAAPARKDGRAPAAGPRLILDERKRVLLGEPARVHRTRSTTLQPGIELNLTGVIPVAAPFTIAVEEGARVELTAALVPPDHPKQNAPPGGRAEHSPDPPERSATGGRAESKGRVRLAVRALEVSLDDVRRESFRGTSLELPSTGDRSLQAVVDVPLGAIALLPLGPRLDPRAEGAPARCAALLVEVRLDAPALEGTALHFAAGDGATLTARFHDAAALLLDPHEPEGGRASPAPLLERWRALAGGAEARIHASVPGGAVLVADSPEVEARLAGAFAALAREARRPVRIDAWVLAGPVGSCEAAGAVAGGLIRAEAARALLSRAAAAQGGLTVAGVFGGGALDDGAFAARSRARVAFTGGVDVVSGGLERNVVTVSAPITRVAESGIALEVRLGRASTGALRLGARALVQRARLERTSGAEPQAGTSLAVVLPSIDRLEVGGRAEIPATGGFALFAAGGADLGGGPGGEVMLLARVSP